MEVLIDLGACLFIQQVWFQKNLQLVLQDQYTTLPFRGIENGGQGGHVPL